jgi:hypothetical protein
MVVPSPGGYSLSRRILATFGVPQLLAVPLLQNLGPAESESAEQRQDLANRMSAQLCGRTS